MEPACHKTLTGKHLFSETIFSHQTVHHNAPSACGGDTYEVEYYFKKCSACGMVDDTKSFTLSELLNERKEKKVE